MARGRRLESLDDYQRALKQKYGIGEGSNYKPWLRVQDVKSHGIRTQVFGRKTHRIHHLMSNIERDLFHICEFSDAVIDLREQFPLLPLNFTQRISKTIGIKHPVHPKTKEPIIITTDLLLTKGVERNAYIAISVKPEEPFSNSRTLEKIDLERVCWQQLGVEFKLFMGNSLTKIQANNLRWATAPFRENPALFSNEQIDYALHELRSGQLIIEGICDRFIGLNLVSHEDALTLLRYLIADKFIEVDLSYKLAEQGIITITKISKEKRRAANGDY